MPANTPLGLPYPLPTEPVTQGAQAIRLLAEAIGPPAGIGLISSKVLAADGVFDFTAIPGTLGYRHLLLLASLRSAAGATNDSTRLRFNADATDNNYGYQQLNASGASVGASAAAGGRCGFCTGNTGLAGAFSQLAVDILAPFGPSTAKTFTGRSQSQFGTAPALAIAQHAGHWVRVGGAAPITQITLISEAGPGGAFKAGSMAALYGLIG